MVTQGKIMEDTLKHITEELYASYFNSQAYAFDKKAQELYDIQRRRKELEALEKKVAAELKDIIEGKSFVTDKFAYTYEMRKGAIDYASIPVLQSINLEAYRKESVTIWKLSRQ